MNETTRQPFAGPERKITPAPAAGDMSAHAIAANLRAGQPSVLDRACVSVDARMSDELRDQLSNVIRRPITTPTAAARAGREIIHIGPDVPGEITGDLVWFHSTNAGVDAVLRAMPWPQEVIFTRTVGRMGRRIAEYVLAWMLEERQRISAYRAQQEQHHWKRHKVELIDGDLAIVFGAGRIGRAVARLLSDLGLNVIGVATTAREIPGFDRVVDNAEVLAHVPRAQWLISTLPLTKDTHGYFGHELLHAACDASFINVGRGATVQHAALREALGSGRLRRAVLDVLPDEPPASDDPLWDLPRTVITPHTAGVTADSDVLEDVRSCWESLRRGERPSLMVDPDRGY